MKAPIRLLGHPLHAVLVHLPIGVLLASFVWDVLALVTGDDEWRSLARWSLALGVASALGAAAVGFVDYVGLPNGDPAERTATRHMTSMLAAVSLLGLSLVFRFAEVVSADADWIIALGTAWLGLALLGLGGYLGGKLVYEHRLGITGEERDLPKPPR